MSGDAPRKQPSTLVVLVAVLGGPLVFVGLFVWLMNSFASYDRVAGDFVRDVAGSRYEAAYRRMASPYRASVPLERFRAGISRNAWFRGATGVDINRAGSNSGGASASGQLLRPEGAVPIRIHFIEEGGEDRITSVVIAGTNALPSPADSP